MSGVLHTDSEKFSNTSSYVGEVGVETRKNLFDSSVITADLLNAYAYALGRERDFYHLYTNANTYEEFLAEVREIFKGAKGDAEKIRNLSNFNLSQEKYIPKDWNKKSATRVTLIIESNPLELDLDKFNFTGVNIKGTLEKGEKLFIQLDENTVKDMKAFLVQWIGEAQQGRQDKHISKKDISISSQFKNDSTADKNLIEWIRKNWKSNKVTQEVLKSIGLGFEISEAQMTIKDLAPNIRPFAKYTKTGANESLSIRDDLKTAKGRARLQATLNDIRHFILDTCLQINSGFVYDGKGNVLKKAAESAWSSIEGEIMSGIESFWLEGRNLSKGLLGAGGEFQVKLISNYLAIVSGNNALAKIIGGIIQDGRAEPRTDVQIISELGGDMGSVVAGIQVKNVNENTASHLSVSSDLDLIAPNLPDGLRDTLANSMFNSDIRSMVDDVQELLENYLKTYFWKSLNLHVGDGLNPNHTNTFYFVGGTTLVPASVIIREMVSATGGSLEPDFTIGNLTNPEHGDKYFASRPGGDKSGEAPYFVDYWKAGRYIVRGAEDFSETAENESLYNKLLKGVSVNAEINMTGIISSYVSFSKGSMDIFPH